MKQELSFGPVTIAVEEQVRISTLNLLHNPDMLDDRTNHLIQNLNDTMPDILCLQEVIFESETDSLTVKRLEAGTALKSVVALEQHETNYGNMSGGAILSSMPVVDSGAFDMGVETKVKYGLYAVLEHGNNVFIAITAHLLWGGDQGANRLRQITTINAFAESLKVKYITQNPIVVLTGDFNANPDHDTLRYLTGKCSNQDGNNTYWTDAWDVHGAADNEHTMVPDNYWAMETAKGQGIVIPQFMPKRRIDYVLSYGWAYGKVGTPLNFMKDFDQISQYGYPISDHAGITVDYWAGAKATS